MNNRFSQGKSFDEIVFPALCAHRGLSGLMPESCLPGFAAGIALGADEIEFDIQLGHDGEAVPLECRLRRQTLKLTNPTVNLDPSRLDLDADRLTAARSCSQQRSADAH